MTAFDRLIHRLLSIPFNKENYYKELKVIKTVANNGYNRQIIDNIVRKKQKRIVSKLIIHQHQ